MAKERYNILVRCTGSFAHSIRANATAKAGRHTKCPCNTPSTILTRLPPKLAASLFLQKA